MKKLFAILLTGAIALTFTSCDSGDGGLSQADADRLQKEIDRLQSELDKAKGNTGNNTTSENKDNTPVLPSIEESPVSDFEYKAVSGGIEITKYIGTSVRVRIPEKIEGATVTSIGSKAFFQKGIMEIYIPSGVINIGLAAFSGNSALTNVTFANDTIKTGGLIHFGGTFWCVLDVQDGKAFIVNEDVIDSKPYHADFDFITWEYSSIRNYLNSEYYNTFNADEQSRIVETMVINSDNPDRGTAGGNNTTDKIFLLSIDEVNSYFSDKNSRIAYNANGRVSWWWLRSPGFGSSQAAYVTSNGGVRLDDVSTYNSYSVNNDDGGVRPALWLNL